MMEHLDFGFVIIGTCELVGNKECFESQIDQMTRFQLTNHRQPTLTEAKMGELQSI
jgi:hypothetical protein